MQHAQTAPAAGTPYLNINNIEVIYDHVILVLKGVSLQVEQGKIVALLGANGAGKTTVLRSILGLTRPRKGEITFEGHDMRTPGVLVEWDGSREVLVSTPSA